MRWILLPALALGWALSAPPARAEPEAGKKPAAEKKGPPFADKKVEGPAAKPESRTFNVVKEASKGKQAFTFVMTPGIPDPGQVTEVQITASLLPTRPDPVYGSQVPMEGARLIVEVTGPTGQPAGRYLTHAMPLAKGRFGFHLTPAQQGIYTLSIQGKTAGGDPVAAEVKLPVQVWPLPPELEGTGQPGVAGQRRAPIKG